MREVIAFPEHRPAPVAFHEVPPKLAPAPRFALVLGSGGVRSIVALGLLEVLVQEGPVPTGHQRAGRGGHRRPAVVARGHSPAPVARGAADVDAQVVPL
jgi:hypothetical protein